MVLEHEEVAWCSSGVSAASQFSSALSKHLGSVSLPLPFLPGAEYSALCVCCVQYPPQSVKERRPASSESECELGDAG